MNGKCRQSLCLLFALGIDFEEIWNYYNYQGNPANAETYVILLNDVIHLKDKLKEFILGDLTDKQFHELTVEAESYCEKVSTILHESLFCQSSKKYANTQCIPVTYSHIEDAFDLFNEIYSGSVSDKLNQFTTAFKVNKCCEISK